MRKIKCSNPKCNAVFGKLLGSKTIELQRGKDSVVVTGGDLTLLGTCGKCHEKTTLFVENNRFDDEDIEFHDDGILSEEEQADLERQKQERIAAGIETEEDKLDPNKKSDEPLLDDEGKPIATQTKKSFLDKPVPAAA